MGGRRKDAMRVPSFSSSPSPSPSPSFSSLRSVEDGSRLVVESLSDGNGGSAILWMSQAAMLSASLSSSQLVIVSVLATFQDEFDSFHISSLERRCSKHFGIRAGEDLYYEPGSFYAIAVAWPCHKLSRNGIRLSRQLANTLGCPSLGTLILVSPVKVSSGEIELQNVRVLRSAESDADNISVQESQCLYLRYCPPEESSLQCQHELLSLPATSNDGKSGIMGSEQGSPKTPFSGSSKKKKTASSLTKMASAEHSDGSGEQDKVPPLRNNSLVLSMLEKGNEMFKNLLQKFVSCMLGGRFLLKGNFITIPFHGQTCLFRVVDAPSSQQSLQTSEDYALDKILPRVSSVFMVCSGTKVCIVPPLSTKDLGSSVLEVLKDGIGEEQKSSGDLEKRNLNLRKLDFSSLGGLSEQIQSLKEIMQLSVLKPDLLMRLGLQPTRGVLLYGPPGTGKTSLALASAYEAGVSIFSINGPEIISEFYGESEAALQAIFTSAQASAPSMVFIDELDAIAPQRKEGSEELAQRMVATLLTLMDGVEQKFRRVIVIAATNRLDAIDPALRRPGRFDMEMEIGVPTPTGRYEILEAILRKMSHSLTPADVQALAAVTHGFVGADLTALCNEAAMIALRRYVRMMKDEGSKEMSRFSIDEDMSGKLGSQLQGLSLSQGVTGDIYNSKCSSLQVKPLLLTINMKDFEEAKSKIGPSAMREVMIEVPKVRWSDIGGNEEVKQQLREAVEWPQKHADAFVRIGTSPPQGVLLYGPPGCSKTLMARAVATEAGLNFISVKGPELLSKWVGESEKAVHKLFARAMAAAPSIVFFDEIDGLAGTRDSGNDGVSVGDRVISQLLVEMDGMKSRAGVTVIAATNRPDRIDPALLRPGRFDRLLYIGPPNADSRKEIFDIHMRTMPCGEDVLKLQLINSTHGYTGADIAAVCREAAMAALEEDLAAKAVHMRHFEAALGNVRPSSFGMSELAYMGFQRG